MEVDGGACHCVPAGRCAKHERSCDIFAAQTLSKAFAWTCRPDNIDTRKRQYGCITLPTKVPRKPRRGRTPQCYRNAKHHHRTSTNVGSPRKASGTHP